MVDMFLPCNTTLDTNGNCVMCINILLFTISAASNHILQASSILFLVCSHFMLLVKLLHILQLLPEARLKLSDDLLITLH